MVGMAGIDGMDGGMRCTAAQAQEHSKNSKIKKKQT